MASNTPNLGLLKKDPATDGNETFNIKTMLNDNWDKIDEAVGNIQVPEASTTQKGIVQLSNATDGTREDVAATEKAVRAAYERGSEGVNAAGAAGSELVAHSADYVKHPADGGITGGSATVYTCSSSPNPSVFVDKMGIVITAHVDCGAHPSIKWGTLASVPIIKANGNSASLKKDGIYTLRYSAGISAFILQGEGGDYGTAEPEQVLKGYTIGTENGVFAGSALSLLDGYIERVSIFANPEAASWTLVKLDPDNAYYYYDMNVGTGWDRTRTALYLTIYSGDFSHTFACQWINNTTVRIWVSKYGSDASNDIRYPKLKLLMFRNIRSFQYGYSDLGVSSGISVPINPVIPDNCLVLWGYAYSTSASAYVSSVKPKLNSNSIYLKSQYSNNSYQCRVNWSVVEFPVPISSLTFGALTWEAPLPSLGIQNPFIPLS